VGTLFKTKAVIWAAGLSVTVNQQKFLVRQKGHRGHLSALFPFN
jgi:hypothetical protein